MTEDAHARTSGEAPEPLYDIDVPTPTHAERARTLAGQITTGTLGSIAQEPAGYPYGSFVTFAIEEGHPVFLISELAEHTKNLRTDSRASLLIAEGGSDDPLANGRVTLLGRCTPAESEGGRAKAAYLKAHPNAAYYADFKDFSFWKIDVESVRYIGGYGRMSWVSREDWFAVSPDPLADVAEKIITHMNKDHAEAMVTYCKAFSKATDVSAASMTGIDRYGFEMSAVTGEGPRPVRLAFPEPISTSKQARQALVAMSEAARSKLG